MAKLADARDLKSRVSKETYRFDSDPGHHVLSQTRRRPITRVNESCAMNERHYRSDLGFLNVELNRRILDDQSSETSTIRATKACELGANARFRQSGGTAFPVYLFAGRFGSIVALSCVVAELNCFFGNFCAATHCLVLDETTMGRRTTRGYSC